MCNVCQIVWQLQVQLKHLPAASFSSGQGLKGQELKCISPPAQQETAQGHRALSKDTEEDEFEIPLEP